MSINIKKDGKLVKIAPTSYNELTDLPNIESSGDVTYITDESGNNVATIGPGGLSTTGIIVDSITLDGEDVGSRLDEIKGEIDFNDLTNNPISDNNDGTVSFADENGNKIVLIDSNGVTSVEFKADGHKLTEKADQSYVEDQITRLETSAFSGDYNDLENAPIINDTTGFAIFADEQGNQIAKIDADGITSVEFKAGTHKLTNKAEKNAPLADFTEDSEHQTVTSAEKTYWSNKSEFSGKFGDLTDSPIVDDNSGELIYTDGTNNIVKIDASGITTTNVAIKEGDVATLIGEKADQTSLDATNNTITATNATVSTHTTEISNLKTEVANDKTALETFKTETADNFAAINKSISDTNNAVDVLESKVSINEEKLEGVQASDSEFTITDGTNIGMKLDSEGLLHVKEVEVAGGRVDERLKDIENYFSTEEDADSNLNKWHEIVNFLNGFEETDQVLENIINTKASKDEVSALSTKVDNNNTSVNTRIDGVETAYKAADSAIETAYKTADAELQKDINTKATQDQVTQLDTKIETVKQDYVSKQELESEVDTEHLITDNITTNQSEFIFFADPYSNKIATIDVDGVSSIEFTAIQEDGTVHNLTNKANISELEVLENKIDGANSKITNLTTDSVKEGTTNKYFTNERAISALSGTLNNYVPNTRKINNKALSSDITLSVSDISGAVSTDTLNALDNSLAAVAKSGSYNDLTNKPTIPSVVNDATVSGWGFTKNAGTVTGVKVNGESKNPDDDGIIDLGKSVLVINSDVDFKPLTDTGGSGTLTNPGVTFAEVKTAIQNKQTIILAEPCGDTNYCVRTDYGDTVLTLHFLNNYDNLLSKPFQYTIALVITTTDDGESFVYTAKKTQLQEKLTSGTNIKTINGNSLLGSGDITITGSGDDIDLSNYATIDQLNNKVSTINNIAPTDGNINITDDMIVRYAVCNSAADSNLKAIELEGYTYTEGSRLVIRLNNGSTVSPSALQVNDNTSGIYYCGYTLPSGTTFPTAHILELTFGKGVWNITGGYQRNDYINGVRTNVNSVSATNYGVCDTVADDSAKVVNISGDFSLVAGAQVVVKFTNGNTSIGAITLNVNNTGAKTIRWGMYSGAWIIVAKGVLTFVYDGADWFCKSSSSALTSGDSTSGYSLQVINNDTCGLAIAKGSSITNAKGDLHIQHGSNENAIYCSGGNIVTEDGCIKGTLVPKVEEITTDITLTNKANLILYTGSGESTITLPASPQNGQQITIINPESKKIYITSSNHIIKHNGHSDNIGVKCETTAMESKMYYINNYWYLFN